MTSEGPNVEAREALIYYSRGNIGERPNGQFCLDTIARYDTDYP